MILIDYEDPYFLLLFPYSKEDLNLVRNLPVREFVREKRCWRVPQLAVNSLENFQAEWSEKATEQKSIISKALLRLIDYKFVESNEPCGWFRPYQKTGIGYLKIAKKALLADEPGLGKTAQSIQASIECEANKVLILCPSTLKWNWKYQFEKHFPEYLDSVVIVKGTAKVRQQIWQNLSRFTIANYDLLLKDWTLIPKEWDVIIADECVALKNPSAKRSRLAKKLKSKYRFALSGIPLENNLLEFHSIMEWVRPEILPNYWRFKNRYCTFDYVGKLIGYKKLDELHQLTSPFILRRTKADVLKDLPPKIYTDIPLEFSEKSFDAYKILTGEFVEWLHSLSDKSKVNTPVNILERLIRFRQFVEFPDTVGFDNVENIKLEWLKELYESTDKVVVFTPFVSSADKLSKELKTKFLLTGKVKSESRLDLIQEFNKAKKGIFVSTDAGRFGVDLVGADTIVHYGYFYNPATMIQREDRLHRIGQQNTVNVLRPYIVNSIDVGIRNIFLSRLEDILNFSEDSLQMSISRLSLKDFEGLVYGVKNESV